MYIYIGIDIDINIDYIHIYIYTGARGVVWPAPLWSDFPVSMHQQPLCWDVSPLSISPLDPK